LKWLFHFVSPFQVVSQLTTFLDRMLAQLGAKRRVALSLPFFVPSAQYRSRRTDFQHCFDRLALFDIFDSLEMLAEH
jgi:hypothetical protein